MVGQTVTHYKITEKLGEGGMGTVYRAEDLKLDRTVALKFVLSSLGADFGGQERLVREAKACAALNHPNITTVYEFGDDGTHHFIAMEFVEGQTLQEAVRERSFDAAEVVSIGVQIADALGAAHAKGIIHRDLKSANVMLDAHGRAKVMDFGLAKLAEGSFVTQTGATLGTAAYMSPEQVRGETLTPKSDIYSLGVVLYELATGVTPYAHAHQLAVMYAVANEEPALPSERNPSVPKALEAVIMKAMAKNPDERYVSCDAMVAALRAVDAPVQPSDSGRPPEATMPRAPLLSRMPPFVGMRWFRVGLPVVLVAVVVAVLLVTQASVLPFGGSSAEITAAAQYEAGVAFWDEAQAYEMRDEMEQAGHRYRLAREALTRAVDLDPTSSDVWSLLASVNAKLGAYGQAILQNEHAIELDAANTEAHYNLGYALEEVGEHERALAAYAEAVRLDSSFTAAYSALGNLLIEQGQPDEAIALLNRAVEKTPDSEYLFLIHKNLGKAFLASGRHEEAVSHLNASLRDVPDWPETTALLARAYEQVGRADESRRLWQRYVELESDSVKLTEARERLAE